jgi:hypothetical protein
MELNSVLELKQEGLARLYSDTFGRNVALRASSLPVEGKPHERLSIGYARKGANDDYELELWIYRRAGKAAELAEEMKEKAKGEATIALVKTIEIPSRATLVGAVGKGNAAPQYPSMRRPLHMGLSIGHRDGAPGTLGAFVQGNDGDGILSNCHVLALAGSASQGDMIYQPGRPDQPRLLPSHRIGSLSEFVELSKTGSNDVDAAYATLLEGIPHDGNIIPMGIGNPDEGKRLSYPQTSGVLGASQVVAKVGRTTGYRTGVVSGKAVDDVPISVPGIGNVRFDNLIRITWNNLDEPFMELGDSGSVAYIPNEMVPFGLCFATGILEIDGHDVGISVACELPIVLDALSVELIR